MKTLIVIILIVFTFQLEWFEEGNPRILTGEDFNATIKQQTHCKFIKFFTPWCRFCRILKSIIDQHQETTFLNNTDVRFYYVNCHASPDICLPLQVSSVPFIMLFDGKGQKKQGASGVYPKQWYVELIQSNCEAVKIQQQQQQKKLESDAKDEKNNSNFEVTENSTNNNSEGKIVENEDKNIKQNKVNSNDSTYKKQQKTKQQQKQQQKNKINDKSNNNQNSDKIMSSNTQQNKIDNYEKQNISNTFQQKQQQMKILKRTEAKNQLTEQQDKISKSISLKTQPEEIKLQTKTQTEAQFPSEQINIILIIFLMIATSFGIFYCYKYWSKNNNQQTI